jgi:hypothetical protein
VPNLQVTADVYESGPYFILDLDTVEFNIGNAGGQPLDEAHWQVSVYPLSANFPYPGRVQVVNQFWELTATGSRTLHYTVYNGTPSPFKVTGVRFMRRLVRIPAR